MCFYLNTLNYLPEGHTVKIFVGLLKENVRVWEDVGEFSNRRKSIFYTLYPKYKQKEKALHVGFWYFKK
jgi:hypothetical protein